MKRDRQRQPGQYSAAPPGMVSGPVFVLLGGVGALYKGIGFASAVSMIRDNMDRQGSSVADMMLVYALVSAAACILLFLLAAAGARRLFLLWRFCRIKKVMGDREMISLEELSRGIHCKTDGLKRLLTRMVRDNYFPQGHMNQEFTCFITSDERYGEYLEILEEWSIRESAWQALGFGAGQRRDLDRAEKCLEAIRETLGMLGPEADRALLLEMEGLVERLLDVCRGNPSNMLSLRTFLNYYLPLSEKFCEEYRKVGEFADRKGENLDSLRRELPRGLAALTEAFDRIAAGLCDEKEIDLVRDIDMMTALIEQKKWMKG